MSTEIRTPDHRECMSCGRVEQWDDGAGNWVVVDDEVGDVRCIHSWDITGEFKPLQK